MNQKLQFILLITLSIFALTSYLSYRYIQNVNTNIKTLSETTNNPISLGIGFWECLPDHIKPQDSEGCQMGIKGLAGEYYWLFYPKAGMNQAKPRIGPVIIRGEIKGISEDRNNNIILTFFLDKTPL
jgi:hypothetical protein